MKTHTNMECRTLPGELCNACYKMELQDYRQFAVKNPPINGETALAYWKRINGPFGDAWYHAAHEAITGLVF
jgi:hypothetical protein